MFTLNDLFVVGGSVATFIGISHLVKYARQRRASKDMTVPEYRRSSRWD